MSSVSVVTFKIDWNWFENGNIAKNKLCTLTGTGRRIQVEHLQIHPNLAYFPCFEKIRLDVCLCIPPINFWMPEHMFMKLGMYIVAPELISAAYFINPSHQSVCLYVYPSTFARQGLSKNVNMATNTHNRRIVGSSIFCMIHISKESRQLRSSSQNFLFFIWQ
jgi:hypothetical protein